MNADDLNKTPVADSGKEDKGQATDKSSTPPAQDSPEFKKAQESAAQLEKLLKDNDCEDVQELLELISTGKQVRGLGVRYVDDIKAMQAKARKLDRWEAHYREQEEKARRKNESPEETIARLERERQKERERLAKLEQSLEEGDQAKQVLENFNKTIGSFVDSQEDIADDLKGFVKKYMGLGHEFAELDITNKKEVNRMAQKLLKEFKDIEAKIIKNYLKTKETSSKVPTTSGLGTPTETKRDGKFKLREAHLAAQERLAQLFAGKK